MLGAGVNFAGVKFEIFRDPLWNNIRVDDVSLRLVDTEIFQRLRYVRQLGWTYLVYPGATHSRFEHALGTYHLSRRALSLLAERHAGPPVDERSQGIVRAAALLHDVGHYPFSHALEEIGALHHEHVARPLITGGQIAETLTKEFGDGAPDEVYALVSGVSEHALQGLISGSLDLDKIDYLKRDAVMCGVPYGEIDVDRLMNSMLIVREKPSGSESIGIQEKALSALESLLFAKYQMYRNVYWHHAVRSATAMYKRLVEDALAEGAVDPDALARYTDEGLLHRLEMSSPSPLLSALKERRLYKRAAEWPASRIESELGDWSGRSRAWMLAAENRLAKELGLLPGAVLLDFPGKTQMLGLDIPVEKRSGTIERLTGQSLMGTINLPSLSDELYASARWLRVFSATRTALPQSRILEILRAIGGNG